MEITPTTISVVALTISILSFILAFRSFDRDKSDLRVSLEYWPQLEREEACFNIRVINHGRRIGRVERFAINFKDGSSMMDSIASGTLISETEPFDHQLPTHNAEGMLRWDPSKVKNVVVFDTLGKRYKFPGFSVKDFFEFRKLERTIRETWGDEDWYKKQPWSE